VKNVQNDIKKAAKTSEYKAGRPYQKWQSVGPKQGGHTIDQSPFKEVHIIDGLRPKRVKEIKAIDRYNVINAGNQSGKKSQPEAISPAAY